MKIFKKLVDKVVCSNVYKLMLPSNLLSFIEYDESQMQSTEKLLSVLSRRPEWSFQLFIEALKKSGQTEVLDYINEMRQHDEQAETGQSDRDSPG